MARKTLVVVSLSLLVFASTAFAQSGDARASNFGERLAEAAIERTQHKVTYDASYAQLDYPGGDVAPDKGVCADVVIRALRALDIDLQKLVHEDMYQNFSAYPTHWGLSATDRNIDHRRVPNLEVFFTRKGYRQSISSALSDYQPGDIVAWNLRGKSGGWLPHIGIVTDHRSISGRPMLVHNIGRGPELEDVLFDWEITGHYRYRD